MKVIKIGTRGSELALYQARLTEQKLLDLGYETEIVIIKTKGDLVQNLSFDKIEGKGFFTKEIEDALLQDEVDIAVHSMKDLPTISSPDLCISALIDRASAQDCLLIRKDAIDVNQDFDLKLSGVVGTSSVRRKSQIQDLRPDVSVVDLRGNVPTRIEKLRSGAYDAIILAAAGISRLNLNLSDLVVKIIHTKEIVPAPAQGAIALQTKRDQIAIRRILAEIHNKAISQCTNIERGVLRGLDGGCQLPLGVHCKVDNAGYYHVHVAFSQNGQLTRKNYSVSTTFGLVDRILNELKN